MEWRKHHHHFDTPNMENAKHYQVQHSIRCKRVETQTSHPKFLVFRSLHPKFTFISPSFHPYFTLISSLIQPHFTPISSEVIFQVYVLEIFLRILKICLPFKPYRIYEFKSEWKPFSKIGTIHYCKDWIRSSIQTIRISTGHHFTVFTVVIESSILRSKLTP